jgi:hypothetical protein
VNSSSWTGATHDLKTTPPNIEESTHDRANNSACCDDRFDQMRGLWKGFFAPLRPAPQRPAAPRNAPPRIATSTKFFPRIAPLCTAPHGTATQRRAPRRNATSTKFSPPLRSASHRIAAQRFATQRPQTTIHKAKG